MGQYHKLVNLDKQEVVHPHMLGLGLKQWEQTGFKGGTLADAIYLLTMTSVARGGGDWEETNISGRWAGDRVVVLGDYTEDSDLPSVPNAGNLYAESEDWRDISARTAGALGKVFGFTMTMGAYGPERVYERELV